MWLKSYGFSDIKAVDSAVISHFSIIKSCTNCIYHYSVIAYWGDPKNPHCIWVGKNFVSEEEATKYLNDLLDSIDKERWALAPGRQTPSPVGGEKTA